MTKAANSETAERQRRRLERAAGRFAAEASLLPGDGRLLVGVSGGPDSTALLLILRSLSEERGLDLTAAYFDHHLRGAKASSTELRAVRSLAQRCEVELVTGEGDVRRLRAEGKLTLEEAARRARYDFLARVAEDHGIATVAVGHTLDDQAETVLMHIVRGAGLTGLGGMHPRSRWPSRGHNGLAIVRPLLRLTRAETEAYCLAAGVSPIEDVSNRSKAFLRNRVRSELLPLLRQYNPGVDQALVRLADAARNDLAVLESLAGQVVRSRSADTVAIDREKLRALAPGLRPHAFRKALQELAGDIQGFSERHLRALEEVAMSDASGASLDLPRGLRATVGRDLVIVRARGAAVEPAPLPERGVQLLAPAEASLGGVVVGVGPMPLPGATAWVQADAEAVEAGVCVRRWRPGDRMRPAGMSGSKKLQDIFVDAHVPRERRGSLPVFEAARGIVWVGGLRLADWARPSDKRPTLVLSYRDAV